MRYPLAWLGARGCSPRRLGLRLAHVARLRDVGLMRGLTPMPEDGRIVDVDVIAGLARDGAETPILGGVAHTPVWLRLDGRVEQPPHGTAHVWLNVRLVEEPRVPIAE